GIPFRVGQHNKSNGRNEQSKINASRETRAVRPSVDISNSPYPLPNPNGSPEPHRLWRNARWRAQGLGNVPASGNLVHLLGPVDMRGLIGMQGESRTWRPHSIGSCSPIKLWPWFFVQRGFAVLSAQPWRVSCG